MHMVTKIVYGSMFICINQHLLGANISSINKDGFILKRIVGQGFFFKKIKRLGNGLSG